MRYSMVQNQLEAITHLLAKILGRLEAIELNLEEIKRKTPEPDE
jgi:hypothetical protein